MNENYSHNRYTKLWKSLHWIVAYCCRVWIDEEKNSFNQAGRGLYFMRMKIVWLKRRSLYGKAHMGFSWIYFSIIYRFQLNFYSFLTDFMSIGTGSDSDCVVLFKAYVISFDRSMYWGGKSNNQNTISNLWKLKGFLSGLHKVLLIIIIIIIHIFLRIIRNANVILHKNKFFYSQNMCRYIFLLKNSIAHLKCVQKVKCSTTWNVIASMLF